MALEGEVGCLELERGAELVEALDVGFVEPGDRGAAIRLDPDETLDRELAERRPERVSRDGVRLREVGLSQRRPRREVAVEDAIAQKRGELVHDGHPAERARHGVVPAVRLS